MVFFFLCFVVCRLFLCAGLLFGSHQRLDWFKKNGYRACAHTVEFMQRQSQCKLDHAQALDEIDMEWRRKRITHPAGALDLPPPAFYFGLIAGDTDKIITVQKIERVTDSGFKQILCFPWAA